MDNNSPGLGRPTIWPSFLPASKFASLTPTTLTASNRLQSPSLKWPRPCDPVKIEPGKSFSSVRVRITHLKGDLFLGQKVQRCIQRNRNIQRTSSTSPDKTLQINPFLFCTLISFLLRWHHIVFPVAVCPAYVSCLAVMCRLHINCFIMFCCLLLLFYNHATAFVVNPTKIIQLKKRHPAALGSLASAQLQNHQSILKRS